MWHAVITLVLCFNQLQNNRNKYFTSETKLRYCTITSALFKICCNFSRNVLSLLYCQPFSVARHAPTLQPSVSMTTIPLLELDSLSHLNSWMTVVEAWTERLNVGTWLLVLQVFNTATDTGRGPNHQWNTCFCTNAMLINCSIDNTEVSNMHSLLINLTTQKWATCIHSLLT